MARLQRPRAGPGRGRAGAAARAGQVPGHLRPEPRRVLPGAGRRPEGPGGGRCRQAQPRRAHARASSSSTSATGSTCCCPACRRPSSTRWPRRLAEAGIKLSSWADLDEDDEKFLVETFEERIFPVLTPLAVDPGPPVPLHLQPVAQPGRDRARPRRRRPPLRPGEGAVAAAPVRGPARRRALRPARAGHRRPPRQAVPGHGDRAAPPLPGHPQHRPHPRGGGGRRPAGPRRGRAAPPPLRPGRAPRDRRRHVRRGARAAPARARRGRRRRLRPHRAARPGRAVGGARARPARPEGPAVPAGHAHPAGRHRRRAGRRVRRHPPRRHAASTTPTRASARRSRSSCARRRPTATCWPSR